MKIFIDTANTQQIKEIASLGVVYGVTTNPSLVAKEKRDFKEVIKEITTLIDGPISAEAISLDWEGMVEEGLELSKIHKNIVVKLPITLDGLKACKKLSDLGIKVNMTLIFTTNQALLAARAGAAYVSPFVGRLDDTGIDGIELIKEIREIFDKQKISTEIIGASIRNPFHVKEAAKAGADIGTLPYDVILSMVKHPLTDIGIKKFMSDWNK